MLTHCWLSSLLVCLTVMGGCRPIDFTTPQRYNQGLVLCLGGAGGFTGEVGRIRRGLHEAGVQYALEEFHWSRGDVLKDQMGIEENRRRASQLARRIEAYRWDYPSRPIYLIGKSAGTGIVVWALEDLQPGHRVDGAILIASSLHSRYDLPPALERISGRMYSFFTLADPILGLGATLAGTVDRRHGSSGGLGGFKPPKDAGQYTKDLYDSTLIQRAWKPTDILEGHMGGHFGGTNPAFVRKHIAPLLVGQDATPQAEDLPELPPKLSRDVPQ